ncbi:MAG: hypothetical protein ACXWV0_09895, partial [Flavisolibacter sp.]
MKRSVPCPPAGTSYLLLPHSGFCSTSVRHQAEFYLLIKNIDMQLAQNGDKVKVHYHGKLRSGET